MTKKTINFYRETSAGNPFQWLSTFYTFYHHVIHIWAVTNDCKFHFSTKTFYLSLQGDIFSVGIYIFAWHMLSTSFVKTLTNTHFEVTCVFKLWLDTNFRQCNTVKQKLCFLVSDYDKQNSILRISCTLQRKQKI